MYTSLKLLVLTVVCGVLASTSVASAQTANLPSGWFNADVGGPSIAGTAAESNGVFTVTGNGKDIWNISDEFHFVYQRLTGDTQIIARVGSLDGAHAWSKAGVMIRGALTGPSAHGMLVASAGKGWAFQRRQSDGDLSDNTSEAGVAPGWVRLVRQANLLSAYLSNDGANWTLLDTAVVQLASTVYVGLAVTSHHSGATVTANFSNVAVSPLSGGSGSPALPAPWSTSDIGEPARAGAAAVTNGLFTVTGSGLDIWNYSDQFRFVYQPVTGDVQIVARVASLQGVHAWSKAGVMIRAALTGPSGHAALFGSTAKGWAFQRRQQDGGLSTHTPRAGNTPGWVRLVREGSLITAYQSSDGTNWELMGIDTISMPHTVYVGLAVTSHDPSTTATATFSNVAVTAPNNTNTPPTVSITSPSSTASFAAPATISISAAASDADGLVTGVQFFANGVLIGAPFAAPFAISWPAVPAGTYHLTAVATDNGGGSAMSPSTLITVSAAAPAAVTRVAFTPSTDHTTAVNSYAVHLRRATDAITAAPVASRDLGKPVPVNGEIIVDISTLVDPLVPGAYYAVVDAIGSGGLAASAPSPAFTK